MVRQIRIRTALVALSFAALSLGLAGCGVKGPLRPAPKATPAPTHAPTLPAPPASSNPKP
ncbi:MAG TPA: lipoprotein [Casimicrobiaceae bacterium]|nr:lipoprotein [Casimicrobiaceae bacterium]